MHLSRPALKLLAALIALIAGSLALLAPASDAAVAEPGPAAHPADPPTAGPATTDSAPPAATATVYRWTTYTEDDGLPSYKGLAVTVDGDRVWIGTDRGLVRMEDGEVTTYTAADGLAHDVVINMALDPATGDLWIGTVAGLTRYSAGKFETFTQLNSGLQNDMVYCVEVDGPHVWAATAAGVSRYDTRTDQWSIWNETNAPMHEPWTYGVTTSASHVYVGAWGGGLLEYDKDTGVWKDYVDPDHEMEIDVFPDDGIVHDIVSFIDHDRGTVWVGTYFGLSVFDGTRWKGYFEKDSGLASDFINFVAARNGVGWIGTDRGLSSFDGERWRTYTRTEEGGLVVVTDAEGNVLQRIETATGPAHDYVLGIDFQGEDIWISTENGVSRGTPDRAADRTHANTNR